MKRHLISAGITFVTAFAIAIIPVIDTITLESIEDGSIIAIVFVAFRAGIKGLLELIVKSKV